MRFEDFKNYKRKVFERKESKRIDFTDINISPYPNKKGEALFRIAFHEKYRASSGYRFEGNKEIYVRLVNGKMRIIAEK